MKCLSEAYRMKRSFAQAQGYTCGSSTPAINISIGKNQRGREPEMDGGS